MKTIHRSIELMKQSWAVLKHDRELIWLPVISALVAGIVAAIILIPVGLSQDWDAVSGTGESASQQVGGGVYLAIAGLTLALAFISIFFRAALVSGAHERMMGGDPTVRSAIAGALERLPKLFGWAVITTIVGSILRAMEQRAGLLGRIVVNMVGMAWAVTTFLVIPVIVIENSGAVDSTKRSVALFRHTWGENLSAQVGFGLIGFLAFIPIVILAAIGATIGTLIGFVLIAVAVVAGIALITVLSALGAIFQTALYHYAVGTELAAELDATMLRDSFARK
ncbi:MAG TPA: hypothetical protein DCY82_17235 [Acidimicrobiaceae bacterium]|nr:hypothetical protein [Acidimicrobiaceae bacterium]